MLNVGGAGLLGFVNVGGGELLVIGLVALIALGPEQLPGVMRKLGALSYQLRSMTSGLKDEFMSALEEPTKPQSGTMGGSGSTSGRVTADRNQPIVPHGYAEQMAAERLRGEMVEPVARDAELASDGPGQDEPSTPAPTAGDDRAGDAASRPARAASIRDHT